MLGLHNHHEFRRVIHDAPFNERLYFVDFVDREFCSVQGEQQRCTNEQVANNTAHWLMQTMHSRLPDVNALHTSLATTIISAADAFDPEKKGYPACGNDKHGVTISLNHLHTTFAFPYEANEGDPFLGAIILNEVPVDASDQVFSCALEFDKIYTPFGSFHALERAHTETPTSIEVANPEVSDGERDPNILYKMRVRSGAVIKLPNGEKVTDVSDDLHTPLQKLVVHRAAGILIAKYIQLMTSENVKAEQKLPLKVPETLWEFLMHASTLAIPS